MGRSAAIEERTTAPEAVLRFRRAVESGDNWFDALLETIAGWEAPEEVIDGRLYRYLIGGEAFDWLLLAERLCTELDGAISAEERDELLFFGKMPRPLDDDEFRHAIGDAKHKAHLNFVYGVAVEEALQLVVEEKVLKEQRSCVWRRKEDADQYAFEKIYGHSFDEMLDAYRSERALPAEAEMTYGELKAFTYWLFKYRMNQSDPARVASDTRKALVQLSELEAAARRRAQQASSLETNGVVVEGVVVARHR